MSDTVILITGQLNEEFTERLILSYIDVKDKLLSLWNNTDESLIQKLKNHDFLVILNDDSSLKNDQHKHNRQLLPIRNGILQAKKLGYKYVLKSRTDIFSKDFGNLIDTTRDLYADRLMAITGIYTNTVGGYFLDVLVCGTIENMLKMFVVKEPNNKRAFELYLLECYIGKKFSKLKKEEVKHHMAFCLEECKKNDFEFIWYRDRKWKTPKRTIPDMKIIKEYCDDNIMYC